MSSPLSIGKPLEVVSQLLTGWVSNSEDSTKLSTLSKSTQQSTMLQQVVSAAIQLFPSGKEEVTTTATQNHKA